MKLFNGLVDCRYLTALRSVSVIRRTEKEFLGNVTHTIKRVKIGKKERLSTIDRRVKP